MKCIRLHLQRQQRRILHDLSLTIQVGEVISLLGANGTGKSTLLSILAGELQASSDTPSPSRPPATCPIILNGHALTDLSKLQQARQRAVLPQKPELAFNLEVSEVIAMGAYPFSELPDPVVARLAAKAMDYADVSHLAQRRYPDLSGGEQQRVHYARVVLQLLCGFQLSDQPRYLLLDEPTSSLDPLHQHTLLTGLRQLADTYPLGVLIVLHDVNLAALFSDRIALLDQGGILACDAPAVALTASHLEQIYGVRPHIMTHPCHADKPLVVFG